MEEIEVKKMDYCKSYLSKGNPVPKDFMDLIYTLDEKEFVAYVEELKKEKSESRYEKYYYNKYIVDDRDFDSGGLIDKCRTLRGIEFENYLKELALEDLKENHFETIINYQREQFEKYLQDVTVEWQRRHRSF